MRQYAEAVARLIAVARRDHGGSRVAAQVLLSAYNGSEFHLDVTDLCILDSNNIRDAITVIEGRATTNIEPHRLIKDGDKVFAGLWEQWKHMRVGVRK